ncbi:LAMI_0E03312g1_1 [Lachancea mirantina]|uniref:Mitochondrial glycine transporter n=1 Tax=Lachancea mirantina TaxID=1230905 RepID=A0A1G4JJL1_9SACH|nr:LAMI_0E03312g1_1 [Lachancea mirantina]
MSEKSKTSSHFIGGLVGGLTSAIALQPFDLLKTRVQQGDRATLAIALKSIENPLQLWKGTLPSALRTSIGSALYLSTLNLVRTSIAERKPVEQRRSGSSFLPRLTMHENLLSGAFTRAAVGFMTMPITVVKVRFESTMYSYQTLGQAFRHIYQHEGIRGFFNGCGATVLRDAPYAGLYVLFYEYCKNKVPDLLPSSMLQFSDKGVFSSATSTVINSIAAIVSASAASTVTAPFDTIKTRMQVKPTKYTGFTKSVFTILKEESPRNLFDGLGLRLTRKALSAGIAWGIYEELIKRFMS